MTAPDLPEALRCPACSGALRGRAEGARCVGCGLGYPWRDGWLDLIGPGASRPAGIGPRLMQARPLARVYEGLWRPAFTLLTSGGRPALDEEVRAVAGHLEPARDGLVLDLSCGPGLVARALHRSGDFERVVGVDLSPAMLDECRARARSEGAGDLLLVRADVGALPFADASVAGLHAGAAMHLWPDPARALAEAARVLRPGGVLVASTFLHAPRRGPRYALERLFEVAATSRFFHEAELRDLVGGAGLEGYRAAVRGAYTLFTCRKP